MAEFRKENDVPAWGPVSRFSSVSFSFHQQLESFLSGERITDSSSVREQRERGLANLRSQTEAEPELGPGIRVRFN